MIWVIANRKEEDGSFPTYKYYKKAFADGKIDIFLRIRMMISLFSRKRILLLFGQETRTSINMLEKLRKESDLRPRLNLRRLTILLMIRKLLNPNCTNVAFRFL